MSLDEKKIILDLAAEGDFDVSAVAKELDRTENAVDTYYNEITVLNLVPQKSEVVSNPEPEQSIEDIKREHVRGIIPSHKGATVMTRAGSEYLDETHKKKTNKAKFGKYAKNVIQIKKDK
jgi:hypothetical protein